MNIFEQFSFNSLQLLWIAISNFLLFSLTWTISVIIKNVSIVDVVWGISFLVQSLIYFCLNLNFFDYKKVIFLCLIIFHNLRLSIYLLIRNYGKGEDKRYKELFRDKFGDSFWWISFFQIFLLQCIISYVLSFIFYSYFIFDVTDKENYNSTSIFIFGCVLMFLGSIYETIADSHLSVFKSKIENKGKVLDKGLFHLSRHPNYFGEFIFWLGCYVVNLSILSYYNIYVPIIIYILLNYVSGTPILDKFMTKTKDSLEHKNYIDTTSSFWPWFKFKKQTTNLIKN